ncbi:MAG: flavodoxin domain-containing protein [Clostridia bacterium]
MSKIAIIYWSGTGNTEAMASCLESAAKGAGAEVVTMTPDAVGSLTDYTAVALGCPSMGAEVLEESEFEPMWQGIKDSLSGKKIGLFGSYGWGDGEWMRNWVDEAEGSNLNVVGNVICQESPDGTAQDELAALATALV